MLGILHGFYCLGSFWVNLWFDPFYEVTISVVTFCLNWNSILFSNKLISNLCIFKLIEIYMILKSIKKLNSNIKRQNKLMGLEKKLNNKKNSSNETSFQLEYSVINMIQYIKWFITKKLNKFVLLHAYTKKNHNLKILINSVFRSSIWKRLSKYTE